MLIKDFLSNFEPFVADCIQICNTSGVCGICYNFSNIEDAIRDFGEFTVTHWYVKHYTVYIDVKKEGNNNGT